MGATDGIDAVLTRFNLDALVLPSEGLAVVPAGLAGLLSIKPSLIRGYPIVTVPLGTRMATGLPFGLSFIGTVVPSQMKADNKKYSEPILIQLMSAYETAFPARALPQPLFEEKRIGFEGLY